MSIDRRLFKRAAKFEKTGSAYIHYEGTAEETPEMLVAGDGQALMWAVSGIIHQLARRYKTAPADALDLVAEMVMQRAADDPGRQTRPDIHLDDVVAQMEADEADRLTDLEQMVATLTAQLTVVQKERDISASVCRQLREQLDSQRRQAAEESRKQTKEILRLEHENEKLTEQLRWTGGR